jgi:hypothetical protein
MRYGIAAPETGGFLPCGSGKHFRNIFLSAAACYQKSTSADADAVF